MFTKVTWVKNRGSKFSYKLMLVVFVWADWRVAVHKSSRDGLKSFRIPILIHKTIDLFFILHIPSLKAHILFFKQWSKKRGFMQLNFSLYLYISCDISPGSIWAKFVERICRTNHLDVLIQSRRFCGNLDAEAAPSPMFTLFYDSAIRKVIRLERWNIRFAHPSQFIGAKVATETQRGVWSAEMRHVFMRWSCCTAYFDRICRPAGACLQYHTISPIPLWDFRYGSLCLTSFCKISG